MPEYRAGVVTDNGNHILDVHNLKILNPLDLEKTINNIVGVVSNGLFGQNKKTCQLISAQKISKFIDMAVLHALIREAMLQSRERHRSSLILGAQLSVFK